ncbi:hypothetical protein AB1Y20_011291 [Prymnesium parvum]|uniref:Zn(2)-C6 fungal-type domain-containing protein n=1 Tax=Prymnesium parvum TaxID=97485 RepID=A0AB34IMS3_PRYPA
MASVCAACRDSKVKCELLRVDSGQCARCRRLGIRCEPAPPSLRGKRTPSSGGTRRLRIKSNDGLPADAAPPDAQPLTYVREPFVASRISQEFSQLWCQMVTGPNVERAAKYLALMMSARAIRCDRPDLMSNAMSLCQRFGFAPDEVLRARFPAAPTARDFPPQLTSLLNSSSGYAMLRCVTPGLNFHATNNVFERALMSRVELDASAASKNATCGELYSLAGSYVHPEDWQHILAGTMSMMGMHVDSPLTVICFNSPERVRVVDRRLASYVPCSVQMMLHWGLYDHVLSLGVDFNPSGPPQRYTPIGLELASPSPLQSTVSFSTITIAPSDSVPAQPDRFLQAHPVDDGMHQLHQGHPVDDGMHQLHQGHPVDDGMHQLHQGHPVDDGMHRFLQSQPVDQGMHRFLQSQPADQDLYRLHLSQPADQGMYRLHQGQPVDQGMYRLHQGQPVDQGMYRLHQGQPVDQGMHQLHQGQPVDQGMHQLHQGHPVDQGMHRLLQAQPVDQGVHRLLQAQPVDQGTHRLHQSHPVDQGMHLADHGANAYLPAPSEDDALGSFLDTESFLRMDH